MKKNVKEVYDYWTSKRYNFVFDSELLDACVNNLSAHETSILEKGKFACEESEALGEEFEFLMYKIFNRHNDIACRYSSIDGNGELVISEKSSITELDISLETMRNCNESCVYHIDDIQKDILPSLTFEAIAEVTAAILTFNEEHKNAGSD